MWGNADTAFCIAALSSLFCYGLFQRRKRLSLPLPPGPKGSPLVGNLFQIPKQYAWKKYHEWCQEYNTDILYLRIPGIDIIVLDSPKFATDLLETRSSIYSSRFRMPMVNELSGWDFNFGGMPYGTRWRKNRRVAHHSLHAAAIKQYTPQITKSTRTFLKRLLDDPNPVNIVPHVDHMAGETILSIAYGLQIQGENDPYLKMARAGVQAFDNAAVPGAYLVDSFPILKYVPAWFPGASFKRKANAWRKISQDMIKLTYAAAKQRLESGASTVSVVSTCLQKVEEGKADDAFTEDIIRSAAGTLFAAGTETTVSIISSCILGLLEHPEVVKKAQAEIDSLIETGHLPELEHQSSLPYISAIVYEALRWRDVAPMGAPHVLTAEDEYNGYRLPAGSMIIANSWAMLHDETVYPDPFTFNPDRFFNSKTRRVDFTRQPDPSIACWGFGRRACPGRHLAFSAIWLAIASLVSAFDIEKEKERVRVVREDGVEREEERTVELAHEYKASFVIVPKPFKCVVKPRSKEKADLIRALWVQDQD